LQGTAQCIIYLGAMLINASRVILILLSEQHLYTIFR